VTDAIVATAAANPSEQFYAGAFWLLFGDYSSLHAPVFGLNCENSDPHIRWHPPDWRWTLIDPTHERVLPLYQPLEVLEVDEPTFELLWEQHIDMLARVSRRVTQVVRWNQLAAPSSAFTPGFFVGIIDFSHGGQAVDYLERSVDEETIAACGILDEIS
jgi:hypothetical protein